MIRQSLGRPARHTAVGDELELEYVREFVHESGRATVTRFDWKQQVIQVRRSTRAHERGGLLSIAWEVASGRQEDERHLHRQIVPQVETHMSVGPFSFARDLVQIDLLRVVDVEMVG